MWQDSQAGGGKAETLCNIKLEIQSLCLRHGLENMELIKRWILWDQKVMKNKKNKQRSNCTKLSVEI